MTTGAKQFDLNKPYTTRDGREAKVLGTSPDGFLYMQVQTQSGRA